MKERAADLDYVIECPLCWEKRIATYHTKLRIQSCNSQGHCKICSQLIRTKTKLNSTDIAKKTGLLKCLDCGLEISVTPNYRYAMLKEYGDNYVCIDCRIAERVALREINCNEATLIKEAVPSQIELFGCILKKENNTFNSNRCALGRKCKHYLECIDAVINLGWDGFTAIGEGHLKEDDWQD